MSDTRYLLTDSFCGIFRVDRETPHFWMALVTDGRGKPYWSRSKKQYGDRIYDTLAEARNALTRVLHERIDRARDIEQGDFDDKQYVFITHPCCLEAHDD